jgi:hypothetical protein
LACGSSLKWVAQPATEQRTLQLQGEIGTCYLVQSSIDLLNWSPVVTITNNTGTIDIPVSPAKTERLYYRAKAVQ